MPTIHVTSQNPNDRASPHLESRTGNWLYTHRSILVDSCGFQHLSTRPLQRGRQLCCHLCGRFQVNADLELVFGALGAETLLPGRRKSGNAGTSPFFVQELEGCSSKVSVIFIKLRLLTSWG